MTNYASWRAVKTSLVTDSDKWAECDDAARVLWLHLLLRCDNRGRFDADPDSVWVSCGKPISWSQRKTATALTLLSQIGLVHTWCVGRNQWGHLVGFDQHQHSEFLRKRGIDRGPIPPCSDGTGKCKGRPNAGHIEIGIGTEIGTKVNTLVEAGLRPALDLSVESSCDQPEKAPCPIRTVFDHWAATEARTGGMQSPKLTGPRRSKINARLAEGYTVDDLCKAIDGFSIDAFHLGKNQQKTRYTGIETIFKSGEKVETGIQLASSSMSKQKADLRALVSPQAFV